MLVDHLFLKSIEKGIDAVLLEQFDCSFSVEKHSTYSWYLDKPLNYSQYNTEQTQFLNPVWTRLVVLLF